MSVLDQIENISGSFVNDRGLVKSAGELFDVINPTDESVIGKYANCTEQEVLDVISTANKVQKDWNKTDHLYRAEILHHCSRNLAEIQPD